MDPLVESKIAESANASANAEQAKQQAYQATLQSALQETIISALHQVLVADEDNSPILVKSKVKRICDAQEQQAKAIAKISSDLGWIKWVGGGVVGGIGLLALKQLGV